MIVKYQINDIILSMIKDRILEIVDSKGINRDDFFAEIEMNASGFRGKQKQSPINSNAIAKILSLYPDINPEWLLTGEGERYRGQNIIAGDNNTQKVTSGLHGNSARNVGGHVVYVSDQNVKKIKENEIEIEKDCNSISEQNQAIKELTYKLETALKELGQKEDIIQSLKIALESKNELIALKNEIIESLKSK